jgi:hypothetical protein
VFLAGGISRVVELSNIGIKGRARRALMVAHVIGCVLFSAVFVVLGLDFRAGMTGNEHSGLVGAFLAASLAILFPVHIYVGIKRRITIRDKSIPPKP